MNPKLSAKLQILSGVAIFMIVSLHGMNVESASIAGTADVPTAHLIQDLLATWLLRSGFPLLSFISGFLFFLTWRGDWNGLKRKLGSRVMTVLVPFVTVSYATIVVYALIQALAPGIVEFARGPIAEWGPVDWLYNGLVQPLNYPIYFLRDVYVVFVVAACLSLWLRHKVAGLGLLALLVVIWWLRIPLWPINYRILTFFCIGAWVAIHQSDDLHRRIPAMFGFGLLFVSIGSGIAGAFLSWHGHAWAPRDMANVTVLSGVLAIWILYDHLLNQAAIRWLLVVTIFNFPIFLLHNPVVNVAKRIGQRVLPESPWMDLLLFLVQPFAVCFLLACVAFAAGRLLPAPWSILTGGRQARSSERLKSVCYGRCRNP
jgi:hypothetical protein